MILPQLCRSPRSLAWTILGDRAAARWVNHLTAGRKGTGVGSGVGHPIAIEITVTGVSCPVAIKICLSTIGDHRTVVDIVGDTITVQVAIARIAIAVAVRIALGRVGDQ